jgi:nuclear GTP-binding protein
MKRPSPGKKNGGKKLGAASSNPDRVISAKSAGSGPSVRSKATINRLNMYRGKVKRNKSGKIVKGGLAVGGSVQNMTAARVQPDRRWFGNTRVVGQQELADFKTQIDATTADPYAVLLRRHKLPMGLLASGGKVQKAGRVDLLRSQPYAQTFGRKAQRKRPRLASLLTPQPAAAGASAGASSAAAGLAGDAAAEDASDLASLAAAAAGRAEAYTEVGDSNLEREAEAVGPRNYIFDAGQSRRIRAELFKVGGELGSWREGGR